MESQPNPLWYYHPVNSRDGRLWLCYVKDETKWALSSTPYFPKSIDLGFRWENKARAVCLLNMVSAYPFGSDDMFAAIKKWDAHFKKFLASRKAMPPEQSVIEYLF
jgi:hypothetical protein